jgi:uncharacterized protein YjbJ (UPF0337 family)
MVDALFRRVDIRSRDMIMNKDQVNGALKGAQGKVQEQAGKAVGSGAQEKKGVGKQAEARLQKAYGNVKEALKNSRHS